MLNPLARVRWLSWLVAVGDFVLESLLFQASQR